MHIVSFITKFKISRGRSAGALLLVGAFAGITVGGGVGVFAASSAKTVTVCANKTTNVLRYSKSGNCATTEISMVLNQTGETGPKGDRGAIGSIGAKGDTGAIGPKGDTGATGPKGDTGPAGTSGIGGGASAPVATGANCIATKCTYKIGDTGPGGGIIIFVDYNDDTSLSYLEAAPMGWGNGITVNQGGLTGETTGSSTADPSMYWCSNRTTLLGLDAWSNAAVGSGSSNTATADATCTGGAIQAAADYVGGGKTDWWLPSSGEAMLMYTSLRQLGVGGLSTSIYATSSEVDATNVWTKSGWQGTDPINGKTSRFSVRPVRGF